MASSVSFLFVSLSFLWTLKGSKNLSIVLSMCWKLKAWWGSAGGSKAPQPSISCIGFGFISTIMVSKTNFCVKLVFFSPQVVRRSKDVNTNLHRSGLTFGSESWHKWATKKHRSHSMKYWLATRDPYHGLLCLLQSHILISLRSVIL